MFLKREYSICVQRIVYQRTKHTRLYVLEIAHIKIILEAEGLSQNGVLPSLANGKMAVSCVLYRIYCLP
jgi:hypothetical protein